MTENLLTIKNALFHLDQLRHLDEEKPEGFLCTKFSQEGILLISNLRFSFFYIDSDNQFQYEHALFNLITKAIMEISVEAVYLDITYAYDRQKYKISHRTECDKLRVLLNKYLGDKFEETQIKKATTENNYFVETTSNTSYDFKSKENIIISPEETQLVDNATKEKIIKVIKAQSVRYFKIAANITVIFIIATLISTFFPDVRGKISKKFIYATNFIKIQQCEKEVYQIGIAVSKSRSERVYNLSEFINKAFEKKYGKRAIDRDPWGNLYQIDYVDNKLKIMSPGPDKKLNTYDDIFKEFTKINKNE